MMNEPSHFPGHEGINWQCPVGCLGIRTVGDLVHLLTSASHLVPMGQPGWITLAQSRTTRPHTEHTEACPLSCLDLSARLLNPLRRRWPEPETIGDLIGLLQRGQLKETRNLGPHRIEEARTALTQAGFDITHPT